MRKGLSPIISAILILLIAISVTLLAIIWLPKITVKVFPQMEMEFNKSYVRSRGCLSIENVKGLFGFVTIKNCGKIALSDFKFFVDGKFINNLNIGNLEPSQSVDFYDMPIEGGKHDIYITADNAESPPYKLNVPYWECMGGNPNLITDWYISNKISCVCSYNTVIPINGNVYVIENGSLSLYNCILRLGTNFMEVRDYGSLNLTNSKLTKPLGWGTVTFEDNSTVYLLNSIVNDNGIRPVIQDETSIIATNSSLGNFYMVSNVPHKLSISNFVGTSSGSPMTKYVKAENSNFTIDFKNVSFGYVTFEIKDNSNTTISNSQFGGFIIVSEKNHNLTVRNWREPFNDKFKAQGSNFEFKGTNLYHGWTYFVAIGYSNNTIIDSDIAEIDIYNGENSTNKFINLNSWGSWYLNGNFTMNLINSTLSDDGLLTIGDNIYSGTFSTWNFSNMTIGGSNRRLSFGADTTSPTVVTFFGNVTFGSTVYVSTFGSKASVTRYFPTIVKNLDGSPSPDVRVRAKDYLKNVVWEGKTDANGYVEPAITFNSSNYGLGNFTIEAYAGFEKGKIDVHLLNSTPLELKLNTNVTFCPDGWKFSTGDGPTGITFNGTYFWIIQNVVNNRSVYRYFANGTYSGKAFDLDNSANAFGITFNGTYFWVVYVAYIKRYRADGTYDGWMQNLPPLNDFPTGITFNGTYFWTSQLDLTGSVERYFANGTYSGQQFLVGFQPEDLVFYNNRFYILDLSSKIHVYNLAGTEIANNSLLNDVGLGGITIDGIYFWITHDGLNMTYRYSECDCNITINSADLPYTISKSNINYCLIGDSFIDGSGLTSAIAFASNVQNSSLDCLGFNLYSNDWGSPNGIYLSSGTKNSTIKNCNITDFYNGVMVNSSNNQIINVTSSSNTFAGIRILGSNNILINNTINKNSYGINISNSSNIITNGSISDNTNYDYMLGLAGTTNNLTKTNFTTARKIYFYDTSSWFNYRNDTGNIWLKTNVSAAATITRKLLNWSIALIRWNDSSLVAVTARYNITGLLTNTIYTVYNNSFLVYTLNSSSNDEISFTINLPASQEREIIVNRSRNVLNLNFNESIGKITFDSSYHSNNGIFYGETFIDGTLGNGTAGTQPTRLSGSSCMYGNCLGFEGTPSVIADVVSTADIPNSSLTIMAWIYPKQITGDERAIVSKWGGSTGTNEWLFRLNNTDPAALEFRINNITGYDEGPVSSSAVITNNTWSHVAVVYNRTNGQVSFYKNGIYVDGGYFPLNGQTRDGSNIVRIGAQGGGTFDPFNGTIDEVRIFNRILSQAEIQAEMSSSRPFQRPITAWSFEESGNYVNDTHIWVNGTFGSALSFDGIDDYVQIPHSNSISGFSEDLTVSFWLKSNDVARRQTIISKYSDLDYKKGWFAESPSYPGNDLGFYAGWPNGINYSEWHANYNPIIDTWYYITVVWKHNNKSNFYVNAAPISTSSITAQSSIYNNIGIPLLIGKCLYDNTRFLNGTIDEIRVWDTDLSQEQIQAEMNKG